MPTLNDPHTFPFSHSVLHFRTINCCASAFLILSDATSSWSWMSLSMPVVVMVAQSKEQSCAWGTLLMQSKVTVCFQPLRGISSALWDWNFACSAVFSWKLSDGLNVSTFSPTPSAPPIRRVWCMTQLFVYFLSFSSPTSLQFKSLTFTTQDQVEPFKVFVANQHHQIRPSHPSRLQFAPKTSRVSLVYPLQICVGLLNSLSSNVCISIWSTFPEIDPSSKFNIGMAAESLDRFFTKAVRAISIFLIRLSWR